MRHLLVLICLAAPALAQAATFNLYGKIFAEYASEDLGASSFTSLDDAQNTGRLGLRFSQSVGDGLTAFGQYEWSMNATDTGGNFQLRDAFVGVRGPFGSLAMGRFAGAYKTTAGIDWDGFQFTSLTPIGQGGLAAGDYANGGFLSRLIEYRTPRLGSAEGLHADAVIQFGGDDAPSNTTTARDSALGALMVGWQHWQFALAASGDKATSTRNLKYGLRWRGTALQAGLVREDVESGGYDPGGQGEFLTGHLHWQTGDWQWLLQAGRYSSDFVDPLAGITAADARYLALGLRYYFARNIWLTGGWRDTASDIASRDSSALVFSLRFDFDRAL